VLLRLSVFHPCCLGRRQMVEIRQLASSGVSIIGIISTSVCILSLLLYFLLIPASRRNALIQVCAYVTFGDLVSSSGLIFGFSNDRTHICKAQAFLTNLGPLWSIFWTIRISIIVMQIIYKCPQPSPTTPTILINSTTGLTSNLSHNPISNSINSREHDLESSIFWHLFCWVWPLILTLLILTTNRYGCGGNADLCWCFIGNRTNSPHWTQAFWTITAFYLWVWSSILIFATVFLLALYRCHKLRDSLSKSSAEGVIVRTLLPYLLVIVICWLFPTIFDVTIAISPNSPLVNSHISLLIASILPTLQGMLTGVIFIRSIFREWRSSYSVTPDLVSSVKPASRQLVCLQNQNIVEMPHP
jgi:hypothetical protein